VHFDLTILSSFFGLETQTIGRNYEQPDSPSLGEKESAADTNIVSCRLREPLSRNFFGLFFLAFIGYQALSSSS